MTWLTATPLGVVMVHIEMMDRIKAEESKSRSVETAVGRRLDVNVEAQVRRWDLRADGGRLPPAAKPTRANLRAIGIGVRSVPKKRKAAVKHG